jgi:hypothetical protein
MRFRVVASLVAVMSGVALPISAQETPAETPLFTAYPSYSAKFDLASEKFSLVTNMLVYNISGTTVTDVSFKQTYPEGVSVKETFQRDVGSEATGEQSSARKVEGNTFFASLQTWKHRQYVAIFNELVMARRLNEITFPGIEISYTDAAGNRQTTTLQNNTYDLFKYSNVVGGFERFLKKYNNIIFEFDKATPNRKEWEFAPIAASAKGRFPTGVIGTYPGEDAYNGYFRIRTGPPGDTIQLLVSYKQIDKKERVNDQERLLKDLREYMRWCGEFEFVQDGLKVERVKWKKYPEVWHVEGQWNDSIKNRLGGGPVEAHVFFGAHEDVEYYILGLAHGRGLGEASATPNADKEAALAAEMSALIDTFKSDIAPLAYDRR